jgi:prepilin-type N-terminal cleavage/methylation domain-containing protein
MHIADLNIGFDSGFTLVEVIVSTLLLGFVALGAILFLFSGVSGYIFSQQASAISQKANLALARLTKELSGEMIEIESIASGSAKYVYQYNTDDHPEKKRYIALVGAGTRKEVKIAVGDDPPTPEDIDVEGVLIDQVSAFTLAFKKCDDSAWIVGDDMDDLCKIELTLELFINSYDNDTVSFTTTVSPSIRKDVI